MTPTAEHPCSGFLTAWRRIGSGVIGPRHQRRWSYKASHARTLGTSLPAVASHERHPGSN
jgi:hypothetical protein